MSPINFDSLRAEHPEYADVWSALQRWFRNNSRKEFAELSVLLRALLGIDRMELVLALQHMVDSGMMEITYRLKAPDGHLLEGEYPEPDLVPAELMDRDYSGYVRREDGTVVSGYRWETADATA